MYIYTHFISFFNIHSPRNKYRIVFTKNPLYV